MSTLSLRVLGTLTLARRRLEELRALQTRDGSMRAPADVVGVPGAFAIPPSYHLTHFLHVALPDGLRDSPGPRWPIKARRGERARRDGRTRWPVGRRGREHRDG